MDTTLADSRDHDPLFGISDGESFVGYAIPYQGNYYGSSPCFNIEGDIINGVLTNIPSFIDPNSIVTSRSYSSEVKLQIRPCN